MRITITIVTIAIIALLVGTAILESWIWGVSQSYGIPYDTFFPGPLYEGYSILGLYDEVPLLRETILNPKP